MPIQLIPPGGGAGHILKKSSGSSFDMEWSPESYTHTQSVASATWTVTHNLGRKPAVTVVDSGDNQVIGDVRYDSDNQLTLLFSAAFGGFAYLT